MKLKHMLRCQIEMSAKPLLIFYSIEILLLLFGVIANLMGSEEIVSIGSPMFISAVYLFIAGLSSFREEFHLGLTNGVSRRTVFWSTLALFGVLSVLVAVVDGILLFLFRFVSPLIFSSIYADLLYPSLTGFGEFFCNFGLGILFSLAALTLGYFISGCFYRLGRLGKVFLSAGLPVGLFVVLPIVISVLPRSALEALVNAWNQLMAFLVVTPWNLSLFIIGIGAVLSLLAWLLIRRVPIQA